MYNIPRVFILVSLFHHPCLTVPLSHRASISKSQTPSKLNSQASEAERKALLPGPGSAHHHHMWPSLRCNKDAITRPWSKEDTAFLLHTHLIPVHLLHIHQDPHELGDGERGVGVVQLDGYLEFTRGAA